jgi:uncharacterized protein YdhG (YjbR/CyaY superfamily)
MEQLKVFMERIDGPERRARFEAVHAWTLARFPELALEFKWNQPMFTHHGTFIISYGAAKPHMSVAPERACIERFAEEISNAGYGRTKELVRIPWASPVNYGLLEEMIAFNMAEKAECRTFWRG